MNMIVCNEKCRHQQEGYCSLTGAAQITNALASPCCYYDPVSPTKSNLKKGTSTYDRNSFT
jgi:hypothetical protein